MVRTPTLRIEGGHELRVPLIADQRSGIFVTRHLPSSEPPRGCLVFAGGRTALSGEEVAQRTVPLEEQMAIRSFVPPIYQPSPRRWWAGHKIEAVDRDGHATVEHWIGQWAEHPGLFAAIPGKAVMAGFVADELMKRLGLSPSNGSAPPHSGSAWDTPVRMMHNSYYDTIDESEDALPSRQEYRA